MSAGDVLEASILNGSENAPQNATIFDIFFALCALLWPCMQRKFKDELSTIKFLFKVSIRSFQNNFYLELHKREILDGYSNWSENCATECPKTILGREHPLQFKFLLNTDNVLVGQFILPNRETGWPTIKDPYTSIVRFDWRFCGDEILRAIEIGEIGVTIGDGAYGFHEINSIFGFKLKLNFLK